MDYTGYVWAKNPPRKSSGLKNIPIRVDKLLRFCQAFAFQMTLRIVVCKVTYGPVDCLSCTSEVSREINEVHISGMTILTACKKYCCCCLFVCLLLFFSSIYCPEQDSASLLLSSSPSWKLQFHIWPLFVEQ